MINPTSIGLQLSLECRGDQKELKILLQRHLITSRFNQKLCLQERRTSIYRKIIAKMRAVRFAEDHLDGCDYAKSVGHDPKMRISLLLDYRYPIFIKDSTLSHVSISDLPNV